MAQTLKDKLSSKDKWIRLLFMLLFAVVVYFIAIPLVWIIGAFQFIYNLFVGKPLTTLIPFSDDLSQYIHQIMAFITYVNDIKPFPFTPWPSTITTKPIKKPKAKLIKTEEKK